MQALNKDSESELNTIKAQSIGLLATAYGQLPRIFAAIGQPMPALAIFACNYFYAGMLKRMIDRLACESVRDADSLASSRIGGKMLVCKLEYIIESYRTQSEYSDAAGMIRYGISIMLGTMDSDSAAESTVYMLGCLKQIMKSIKKTLSLEDFVEFDVVSKVNSALLGMLDTRLRSVDHKNARMALVEIIGICYFADETDDYLDNIKQLADKLICTKQSDKDTLQEIMLRTFYDLGGMMKAVSSTKVAISIIRIWYLIINPAIQE